MNTVKITLVGSQLDIEYHGSGIIPTASLNMDGNHDLRKLIAEMAEWCSRKVAFNAREDQAQGIMLPPPGMKPPTCSECGDTNLHPITEGPDAGWWECAGSCALHKPVASNSTEEPNEGYSFEAQMAHYPDPPPEPKPTLANFPNGLLGTWWSYMGSGQPGKVIHHEGEDIRLNTPTATEFISLDWLFDAYTQVEAPQEAQDWARCEPIIDMGEGPSATVLDHHPV